MYVRYLTTFALKSLTRITRADHLLELDPEPEWREAFECFDDGDKGIISGQELRKWLNEVGDRMSPEEVRSY